MASNINFFSEEIDFKLKNKAILRNWIKQVIGQEGQSILDLNFIFCSDEYLLNINREYLEHDYYTDIITFDNREALSEPITSDIFISIDRVQDNSVKHETTFNQELFRVMIHGVLHLLGQGDKTEEEQTQMRKREEASLSLLSIPKE